MLSGNYQPKQCENQETCWCVSVQTGEKRGTFSSPSHLLMCSMAERAQAQGQAPATGPPLVGK